MNVRLHTHAAERRSFSLEPTRRMLDQLDKIIERHRQSWPLPLLPDWLDELINYREQAVALLRDGRMKRAAEVCNASD